jgi:putative dimethyl sulfoxide reductase chaperone
MDLSLEALEVRASLYGLLARGLFSEPSLESLKVTKEELSLIKGRADLQDETALMANLQTLLDALEHSVPELLAVDYAGLFLGGREGSVCPSESVCLEGKIFGETTIKVIEFYGQQGFAKDSSFQEPDDHIAVECAFMSVLGWKSVEIAQEDGLDSHRLRKHLRLQHQFLTEHLLKWLPAWVNQVQVSSETEFYRAFSSLAVAWMEADRRLLVRSLPRLNRMP